MGTTTELRSEIKARFFPLAMSRAFELSQQEGPFVWAFSREINGEKHNFDIQWEKYGRPRFVVNFKSKRGWGRLQPGKGALTASWFRQDSPWLSRLLLRANDRRPAAVVDQLIALFAELELFFEDGTVGEHMQLWPDAG